MTKVYMIAHFTEAGDSWYAGIRNQNFVQGLYKNLKNHYDEIIKVDASQIDADVTVRKYPDVAFSSLKPVIPDGANIFYLQTAYPVKNDISHSKLVYFHIDGAFPINSSGLDYGLRMYAAPGKHDYKVAEESKIVYPFVFMKEFNPDRKKDIVISCISRSCSYKKYKDLLERSQFTVIDGYEFISKRAFQALACKTIPIIITDIEHMWRILGFKEPFTIFQHNVIGYSTIIPEGFDLKEIREEGYAFMNRLYSGKKRMKQIIRIMEKVYNRPSRR